MVRFLCEHGQLPARRPPHGESAGDGIELRDLGHLDRGLLGHVLENGQKDESGDAPCSRCRQARDRDALALVVLLEAVDRDRVRTLRYRQVCEEAGAVAATRDDLPPPRAQEPSAADRRRTRRFDA